MKLMALLLLLVGVSATTAHTLVQFSPSEGYSQQRIPVAAGFAYAFRTPTVSSSSHFGFSPNAAKSIDAYSGDPRSRSFAKSLHSAFSYDGSVSNTIVPVYHSKPAPVEHRIVPLPLTTQYHSQDELGQYAYGYVNDDASHHEERSLHGGVSGYYSYYDPDGVMQSANYVSDSHGYRVQGTGIPVAAFEPVQPTPEVQAATYAHLQAVSEARARKFSGKHIHVGIGETPEVAAARAAHLKAFNDIKKKHASRWRRSAFGGHGHSQYGYNPGFSFGQSSHYQQYSPAAHHPFEPVTPTPAVQAATYAHLQAVQLSHQTHGHANVGIPDTPAVAAAKKAHFHAYHQIQQDHARRWKRNSSHNPNFYTHRQPQSHVSSLSHSPVSVESLLIPTHYSKLVTAPEPVVIKQYHSQNELGQYEYGYSGGPSAKHEKKGHDGVTRGEYSYVDPYGLLQRVEYEADGHSGFRIVSATNVPQRVQSLHGVTSW